MYKIYGLANNGLWDPTVLGPQEPDPPPSCPTTWRLKTEEEAGVGSYALAKFGGQYGQLSSDKLSLRLASDLVIDFDADNPAEKFVVTETTHSFVNNGCQRSFCKVCDANGAWDWQLGKFIPE